MKIAIFGLGYVGCVTATCLAREGHEVIGVDVQRLKIEAILAGKSPIVEPGLAELIIAGVQSERLTATEDAVFAINQAELALICVGTPSNENGSLDLAYLERVCGDIGVALGQKEGYTVIVVRSTLLPGSAQTHLLPLLEQASGKKAGSDFGFCVNPEFLREGSAIADFENPPYTVIGELDARSGDYVTELYATVNAPLHRVSLGTAEMVKYASNAFHALKITFANEIGNLSQSYGIDSHQVMDIFVQDTKLNLSKSYLKPGFAFGGSCLGKDMRALLYAARQSDLRLPVLESVLPSNQLQIEKVLNMLLKSPDRRVGIIGLSFKPDTDDLRESPAVELTERLLGKGFAVQIYDREVLLSRLHGSNRAFIDQVLPHVGSLLRDDLAETISAAQTVVVTKRISDGEYSTLRSMLRPNHTLIDLVRLNGQELDGFGGVYRGICW
jgi:GDP-mannose 6-dehydrogenase